MKSQFANTIEKLKSDHKRAVKVVNNDTGATLVCDATGAELTEKHGSIENYFNSLFEKGIKAIKVFERRHNGMSKAGRDNYREYGDPYIHDFNPVAPVQTTVSEPTEKRDYGLNVGLNAVQVYRDMDYPKLEAKFLAAESENKTLSSANQKLEMKLALIEAVGQKSDSQKESNAQMFATAAPILEALASKLLAQQAPTPGLSMPNVSEVKQHGIKIISQIHDDIVDNINLIMLKANKPEIEKGILELADLAETFK